MNKTGIGIGSASVVLVFAVLCLTVFTLISYTSAVNDRALADVEAKLVKDYYEADTLAERIVAELLAAGTAVPGSIHGVDIGATRRGGGHEPETAEFEFACAVSTGKELYVKMAVHENSYDILSWRMRNTAAWQADDDMPVWLGE